MGYWLLDHRNPNGDHFYPTRRNPILAVVVHITAGLEDQDMRGNDDSAEATARYAASTARRVSWHAGADSDSVIDLLPDSYTAFHVRGYNSSTLGLEISKSDITWADEPADWVTATLNQGGPHVGAWCRRHRIPIRRCTVGELDHAIRNGGPPVGLIGHSELDPTRRRDPGPDFPWDRLLNIARHGPEEDDMLRKGHRGHNVKRLKVKLNAWAELRGDTSATFPVDVDEVFDSQLVRAVERFQNKTGMQVTGEWAGWPDGAELERAIHELKEHR